jgi:LysM repeat protein
MESDLRKKRIQPKLVLLSVVLALALLVSALPQTPAAAQNCKVKHTVEAGDTINYLANLYSVGWEQIANANDLLAPYTITVGQVLCIPGGTETEPTTKSTETADKSKEPTLDVVPQMSRVCLGGNFAPKTSYFVASSSFQHRLLLVGVFTTNKGDAADWFKIPLYAYYQ